VKYNIKNMNNLDTQYQDLLKSILEYGIDKNDRTGTGTKSIFGYTIRHNMKHGFPLLTTKKMAWKSIVTELIWFLKGDTNIKFLVDNDCHIWDGDAYKNYVSKVEEYTSTLNVPNDISEFHEIMDSVGNQIKSSVLIQEEFINKIKTDDEFAKKWGDLGPIYGKQWRQWQGWMDWKEDGRKGMGSLWFDQIQRLLTDLKRDPDSRRLMVNAWNVAELDQMVLPPCHYGFQVYTRLLTPHERLKILQEKGYGRLDGTPLRFGYEEQYKIFNVPTRAISLMWNQRSVDAFLGLPFNIASYGLLLSLLAKEVNMVPDELIGNLGDTHLYLNHIEQAKEQIGTKLTFDERYALFTGHDKTWEEGGGNAYGKINGLDMMDDAGIPIRTREPYELPTLNLNFDYTYWDGYMVEWDKIPMDKITIENYKYHPTIKAPLSN
jgi:thymidylate synthase